MDGEIEEAFAPMSVAMTLNDEIDISRGDMLVKPNNPPAPRQDVEAMICWFSSEKKLAGRGKYILRHTEKEGEGHRHRGEIQGEHQHPAQDRGRPRLQPQ